jgi:hypothetical protein
MSNVIEYKSHKPHPRWNRFFGVPSASNPSRDPYVVSVKEWKQVDDIGAENPRQIGVDLRNWACSCPRWTLNSSRPECRHIREVKYALHRGYIASVAELPEKLAQAIAKIGGAFEAAEIQDEKKTRKVKGENETARKTFEALELD